MIFHRAFFMGGENNGIVEYCYEGAPMEEKWKI